MSNTSKYVWTAVQEVEGTLTFVALTPAADGKVQARKDREIAAGHAKDGDRLALIQVIEEGQVKKVCAFVPDEVEKAEKPKKAPKEEVEEVTHIHTEDEQSVEELMAETAEEIAPVLPPPESDNGTAPEAFTRGATLYINLPDGTQYKRMYQSAKGVTGVLARVNDYIENNRPLTEFLSGMVVTSASQVIPA
jgi:hypothetical protein